jgi:hypothetical protein
MPSWGRSLARISSGADISHRQMTFPDTITRGDCRLARFAFPFHCRSDFLFRAAVGAHCVYHVGHSDPLYKLEDLEAEIERDAGQPTD